MSSCEQRDERIQSRANQLVEEWLPPYHTEQDAFRVVDKAAAMVAALEEELLESKPRTITTVEELEALPDGSVVLAHWSDNSQPDYQMMRCPEGGASAGGGFGLAGGSHWLNMWSWGATLTVTHEPSTGETK